MNTQKIVNDICAISKCDVNLMDMKAVAEKARQIGLLAFAELIENDLSENKIINGSYFRVVQSMLGA
jgi:hypothetical protein